MSENQTKKCKCSSWLTEAASYGAQPVEPVPNWFSRLVKISNLVKTRMSENQTKKGKCSSWLTEAASYGAEPVEPVPNRFSRLGRKDDEEGEKAYEDEEDKLFPHTLNSEDATPFVFSPAKFPSPKCQKVLCSPILSPFILIPSYMGTTPLITSLRLTRPAHSLQFFQLASPPRIHMDSCGAICERWVDVTPKDKCRVEGQN
ncbi:hypothetical protein AAG906_005391 [Vitis piasezkii]